MMYTVCVENTSPVDKGDRYIDLNSQLSELLQQQRQQESLLSRDPKHEYSGGEEEV